MRTVNVLIIEDDPDGRQSLKEAVEDMGCKVTAVENGADGVTSAVGGCYDVILCDLVLPDIDGLEVLSRVKKAGSEVPFVMMTAYGTVSTAVQALKSGAYDYLTKPLDLDEIQSKVKKASEVGCLREKVADLQAVVAGKYSSGSIIAEDNAMVEVIAQAHTLADTNTTVLVQGESGTGKELIARALHVDGSRGEGPFVAVNCGAFSESLLESELFGHEKGAFTGASSMRKGAFERADGGTLFLDEIGNAPRSVQVKLLRVLEEKEIMRVGGEKEIKTDVRVVSASNRILEDLAAEGEFREDLLYRLKVVTISIPPLRERPVDIRLLVNHFASEVSRENGRKLTSVDEDAYLVFESHNWPGNVRELRNVVESSVIMMQGSVLRAVDVRLERQSADECSDFAVPDGMNLDEIEKEVFLQFLGRNKGNKTIVAEKLGVSRRTIQRKIQEYDLPF